MVERQNTQAPYTRSTGAPVLHVCSWHDKRRACQHTAGLTLLKHSNRNKDTGRHRGKSLQRKLVRAESLHHMATEMALSYMIVSKVGYCNICYAYILQDYKEGGSHVIVHIYVLLKSLNYHMYHEITYEYT